MESTEHHELVIGLIGCGNIARIAWAPNFRRAGVRLLCFDVNADNARALAEQFGGEAFDTLDELLAQRPDGCVVATWAGTHFQIAMKVVEAGIHLIVEKPMTTSLDDAKALVVAARERGVRIHQPYHQLLMLKQVLELVRGGDLGVLSSIEYRWLRREPGQGLLEDLGPHAIAMALALGVRYEEIQAVTAHEREGTHLVSLFHPRVGVTIKIGSGLRMPVEEEVGLRVVGTLGWVEAHMRTTKTPTDAELDYRPELLIPRGPAAPLFRTLDRVEGADVARALQADTWLASLREEPGQALPVDALVGLQAQAVLDAAVASHEHEGLRVEPDSLSGENFGSA